MITTQNRVDYIKTYYPLAKIAGEKYNINPLSILSQGALESAWGTSFSATNRNNLFGILASGATNEYWHGAKSQSTSSKLWFRIYESKQDSIMDFARLISSKYKSSAMFSHDIPAYADSISKSPYISESNGDNRESYRKNIISSATIISRYIPVLFTEKKN